MIATNLRRVMKGDQDIIDASERFRSRTKKFQETLACSRFLISLARVCTLQLTCCNLQFDCIQAQDHLSMALNDVDLVKELIEDLEVNIDELDEALKPLVSQSLVATANSLPLLDRAKLFTTAVYAIDSLLYNSLNIAGTDAKTHAVKTELDRVKQYFDKIKAAENPVGKRENLALDKPAAARFITAALRGNDKYDQERSERETRERAGADAKLQALNGKRKDLSQEEHNPNKKNLETSDSEPSPSKFHA